MCRFTGHHSIGITNYASAAMNNSHRILNRLKSVQVHNIGITNNYANAAMSSSHRILNSVCITTLEGLSGCA